MPRKLIVDTTLPPQLFQRTLMKAAAQARADARAEREAAARKEALRAQGRALAEQMGGWSESAMGELAEVFAAVQQ